MLGLPGAVSVGGDAAAGYGSGEHTTVGYQAALNPPPSNRFTIEFWAKPLPRQAYNLLSRLRQKVAQSVQEKTGVWSSSE